MKQQYHSFKVVSLVCEHLPNFYSLLTLVSTINRDMYFLNAKCRTTVVSQASFCVRPLFDTEQDVYSWCHTSNVEIFSFLLKLCISKRSCKWLIILCAVLHCFPLSFDILLLKYNLQYL